MKNSALALLILAIAYPLGLQGAETGWLLFNNIMGDGLKAPVSRADGSGAGAGVTGQLFVVNTDGSLKPLLPTTTFRTSPEASSFYVNPVLIQITPIHPFETVTLRMRAWTGKSFATATLRGESKDFSITFGSQPSRQFPMYLIGLEAFPLEPHSYSIFLGPPRIVGHKFILEIRAVLGLPILIQSSTNLKDWETFSEQTLEEDITRIALPIENASRFYRVVVE